MEYRFIHYWQYEPTVVERQLLEEAISLSPQERTGNFLTEAATFIARHTKARYVIIGTLANQNTQVNTCIFLKDGQPLGNFSYSLSGTPCDAVFIQRFCYYPVNVADAFPEDKELEELNIESYLGSILLAENSEPVGLIALMDEKPLQNPAFSEHLILVLSPTIEEELCRIKQAEAVSEVNTRL